MGIMNMILAYVLVVCVFFAIDLVWLGLVAKGIYQKYLGNFLADEVNWVAAIIFYLVFIVGIFIFAIMPGVEKDSVFHAALLGGLFGFFTYWTYDLTNMATLKDWPIQIVFIDVVWGFVLTMLVSVAGFYIVKFLS